MKNIGIFALLITSFSIKAQHILTASNYNPSVADIDVQYSTTNTVVPLGSSGSGQTWNYTNLIPQWPGNSATMVSMSSVANASLFSTGTISKDYGSGNYDVFENTLAYSKLLGNAVPSSTGCTTYSNPITFITFPFTLGSSYTDTYAYTQPGTSGNGTVAVSGAGAGTLQTPGKSFSNVLKVSYNFTETVTSGTSTSTSGGTEEMYYNASSKFPLLTVYSVTSGSLTFSGAQLGQFAFTGIAETKTQIHFNIHPNPTSNHEVTINFNVNESDSYTVKVINTIGQEVKTIELSEMSAGQHSSTIDLQDLSSGIYFLKLKNKTGESIKKLIIE